MSNDKPKGEHKVPEREEERNPSAANERHPGEPISEHSLANTANGRPRQQPDIVDTAAPPDPK